jgi:mevalonate kinase
LRVYAKAPGKAIICGEHFVVHGSYALAAALNRTVICCVTDHPKLEILSENLGIVSRPPDEVPSELKAITLSVEHALERSANPGGMRLVIRSDIPVASGLGSSAAVAVASVAAATRYAGIKVKPEELAELAMVSERMIHGNPSGIDIEVSLRGGVILFKRGEGSYPVSLPSPLELILASEKGGRKTSEMIERFRRKKDRAPSLFEGLVKASSTMSKVAADALKDGDSERLGSILTFFHMVLMGFDLSTQQLNEMVDEALGGGCVGAKMTGAGGGGSIVCLPYPSRGREVIGKLESKGYKAFSVSIPQEGLQVWEEKD